MTIIRKMNYKDCHSERSEEFVPLIAYQLSRLLRRYAPRKDNSFAVIASVSEAIRAPYYLKVTDCFVVLRE
jgi:hypothetical protein